MAKSNQARVNGGSNYDSLKVAKCLVIIRNKPEHRPVLEWGWGGGRPPPLLPGKALTSFGFPASPRSVTNVALSGGIRPPDGVGGG